MEDRVQALEAQMRQLMERARLLEVESSLLRTELYALSGCAAATAVQNLRMTHFISALALDDEAKQRAARLTDADWEDMCLSAFRAVWKIFATTAELLPATARGEDPQSGIREAVAEAVSMHVFSQSNMPSLDGAYPRLVRDDEEG